MTDQPRVAPWVERSIDRLIAAAVAEGGWRPGDGRTLAERAQAKAAARAALVRAIAREVSTSAEQGRADGMLQERAGVEALLLDMASAYADPLDATIGPLVLAGLVDPSGREQAARTLAAAAGHVRDGHRPAATDPEERL